MRETRSDEDWVKGCRELLRGVEASDPGPELLQEPPLGQGPPADATNNIGGLAESLHSIGKAAVRGKPVLECIPRLNAPHWHRRLARKPLEQRSRFQGTGVSPVGRGCRLPEQAADEPVAKPANTLVPRKM